MKSKMITVGVWRQRGISAIEFALVFPVMILVFYTLVSYSMVFLYMSTLNSMAAESARSAVAVFTSDAQQRDLRVTERIGGVIGNSWFPTNTVTGCSNGNEYFDVDLDNLLTVCLTAPRPMPALQFGALRIPDVPDQLTASASVQLGEM